MTRFYLEYKGNCTNDGGWRRSKNNSYQEFDTEKQARHAANYQTQNSCAGLIYRVASGDADVLDEERAIRDADFVSEINKFQSAPKERELHKMPGFYF